MPMMRETPQAWKLVTRARENTRHGEEDDDERRCGSRIAEGDERSELVLDAVVISSHSEPTSTPSTMEDLQ